MTILPALAIAFPSIDPVIFSIGPLSVHWYGVGYVVGILFAWWWAKRLAANTKLWRGTPPVDPNLLDDFVFWAAIGVVAGGRIGYILFYDLAARLADPLSIFRIWEGGMSFHGGLIGVILAMVWFARKNGIRVLTLFDLVAAGVPVALGLVRCTNFINSELWGKITTVPWGIVFPNGGPEPRHPSQLYEAILEGPLLFVLVNLAVYRFGSLNRPGLTAGLFVGGYSMARIFVELFREPDGHIGYLAGGWLTMGMVLSLPMLAAGAVLVFSARNIAADNNR